MQLSKELQHLTARCRTPASVGLNEVQLSKELQLRAVWCTPAAPLPGLNEVQLSKKLQLSYKVGELTVYEPQ